MNSEPWSKEHKRVFGGCRYSLSNSFAQPLTNAELLDFSKERGDTDIIDEYHNHGLDYTPNGGSDDLREEIATRLYGDKITKDHILIFPGAQVALQTAAFAFVTQQQQQQDDSLLPTTTTTTPPPCHSIVFVPGYQSTVESPLRAGGEITKIRLRAKHGWRIDPAEVEGAIRQNTKYMILNQPYNPAGVLMDKQTMLELRDIADRHEIIILSDEVYRLLEHDSHPQDNTSNNNSNNRLPPMAEFYKRGISCVTMAKPWGGCGITIGWLAFQNKEWMKQKLVDAQYFGTACPSRASEIQAIMVLRASDRILERNLAIIRSNMVLWDHFMERYGDLFEWVRPTAGAIGFVKFKGVLLSSSSSTSTSRELGELMAKEASLSMKPAYCFIHNDDININDDDDDDDDDIDCYFRVGYGEASMPETMKVLISFVEQHKDEWRARMGRKEGLMG